MKNIKFRAKITGTDCWIYGLPHAVYSENHIDSMQDANTKEIEYIKTDTLGMFTGEVDKNGNELYHGDICRTDDDLTFVVKWNEEAMAFMAYAGIHSAPLNWFCRKIGDNSSEKIGNMYDNPELLN